MYQDTLTTKFIKPVTVTMKLLVEKVLTTTDYQKESISIKRTDLCASVESALVSGRRLLQRSLRQPFQGSNGILRDYLNKKNIFYKNSHNDWIPTLEVQAALLCRLYHHFLGSYRRFSGQPWQTKFPQPTL